MPHGSLAHNSRASPAPDLSISPEHIASSPSPTGTKVDSALVLGLIVPGYSCPGTGEQSKRRYGATKMTPPSPSLPAWSPQMESFSPSRDSAHDRMQGLGQTEKGKEEKGQGWGCPFAVLTW